MTRPTGCVRPVEAVRKTPVFPRKGGAATGQLMCPLEVCSFARLDGYSLRRPLGVGWFHRLLRPPGADG
jgi:hypothetical protein